MHETASIIAQTQQITIVQFQRLAWRMLHHSCILQLLLAWHDATYVNKVLLTHEF